MSTSQFSPAEISRYRRQLSLAGFGPEAQGKLKDAHIAVIGAGGLGSPALLYLAGAGVGTVTLFDDDVVSISNLHRQVIHGTSGVGKPKAESARDAMADLNPEVDVHVITTRLTQDNALDLLGGADVVMDGSDNFGTRYLASWACAKLGVPHVWASILGFDAQMTVFHAGHGPIYEDLFPVPPAPGSVPSCSQAGVLGPVVGVVGSAMALEAIKLVTGVGTPMRGRLGYFSALNGTWEYIPLASNPETLARVLEQGPLRADDFEEPVAPNSAPGHEPITEKAAQPEVAEIPEGALVIDVREPHEHYQFSIPGALLFPLGRIVDDGDYPPEIPEALAAGRPVVMQCAGGVRSLRAVEKLEELGVHGTVSLAGGIDAWLDRQA